MIVLNIIIIIIIIWQSQYANGMFAVIESLAVKIILIILWLVSRKNTT